MDLCINIIVRGIFSESTYFGDQVKSVSKLGKVTHSITGLLRFERCFIYELAAIQNELHGWFRNIRI